VLAGHENLKELERIYEQTLATKLGKEADMWYKISK